MAELAQYSEFIKSENEVIKSIDNHQKRQPWFFRIVRGGPAEFMFLANGLIVAGMGLILISKFELHLSFICKIAVLIILFLFVVLLQWAYSQRLRNKMVNLAGK